MKPRYEPPNGGNESETIKSEIAQTREKMDHTLDELGKRITPRHLLDELLQYFRSPGNKEAIKDKAGMAARKAGDTASQASHAVVEAIKQHPIPSLLIGAGVAWALYERQSQSSYSYVEDEDDLAYAPSTGEEPGFAEKAGEKLESGLEAGKQKLQTAAEKVKEKFESAGNKMQGTKQSLREKSHQVRDKAGQMTQSVKHRAREGYIAGRDRIAQATDEQPLATGLACLAMGILAGLALPSTRQEDELIGSASDRIRSGVREKGQEYVERARIVATKAVEAAKETATQEAGNQGLTAEGVKKELSGIAQEAKSDIRQTAEEKGLVQPGQWGQPGAV